MAAMHKSPGDRYLELVEAGAIEPDPGQRQALLELDRLFEEHARWRSRGGLLSLFYTGTPPRGIYLYGRVGRGKTMLMDLFFESVPFRRKRRTHFHEFMAEVHTRIAAARQNFAGDPIPVVAAAIAEEARLLCFDELHVTDIADAMILGRLFKELFAQRVVVVATSNSAPRDLYRNGLNRDLFLPFVALIEEHMAVLELDAAKDFRLDKLEGQRLYFTPADAVAKAELDRLWLRLTGSVSGAPMQLQVKGRTLTIPQAARGVARFTFAELCEQPLGSLDYLLLARTFHTLLLDAIPVLVPRQRNEARRLINLIDTLYDQRVCLAASADAEPAGLYAEGPGADLFERTASRLVEMRSEDYLKARLERAGLVPERT
jgi:cell division protein ZapE